MAVEFLFCGSRLEKRVVLFDEGKQEKYMVRLTTKMMDDMVQIFFKTFDSIGRSKVIKTGDIFSPFPNSVVMQIGHFQNLQPLKRFLR